MNVHFPHGHTYNLVYSPSDLALYIPAYLQQVGASFGNNIEVQHHGVINHLYFDSVSAVRAQEAVHTQGTHAGYA